MSRPRLHATESYRLPDGSIATLKITAEDDEKVRGVRRLTTGRTVPFTARREDWKNLSKERVEES
jgi:hypothetical protein